MKGSRKPPFFSSPFPLLFIRAAIAMIKKPLLSWQVRRVDTLRASLRPLAFGVRDRLARAASCHVSVSLRPYVRLWSHALPSRSTGVQVWDEHSQAHYFFNDETQATQWEQPDDFGGEVRPDHIEVDEETANEFGALNALRESVAGPSGAPTCAWTECYDEASGCWFYYNAKTGETSWDEPEGFDREANGGFVAVVAAGHGYQIVEHKPLCASCFDRETPLYRSRLLWLLVLLALVAGIVALVLSLGECDLKFFSTITELNTLENVTTPLDVVFVYDRSGSMSDDDVKSELLFMETLVRRRPRLSLGCAMVLTAVFSSQT